MRNKKGQFVKGSRSSPETEFKKGQHWRKPSPLWDAGWLKGEYVDKKRSAGEIAADVNVTEGAVYHWLKKHGISTRSISECRKVKYWGLSGDKNPMYGKRGPLSKHWKGGYTPLRQKIYSTIEMKEAIKQAYIRDRVCRLCGAKKSLVVHHIHPFSQAPLLVADVGNLVVLCDPCHKKMKGKENRWKKKLIRLIYQKGGDQ